MPLPQAWEPLTARERYIVFASCSLTELARAPALAHLARRCAADAPAGDAERLRFSLFALCATCATSFLYHTAQALCVDRRACRLAGLSEGQWHLLDNVASVALA